MKIPLSEAHQHVQTSRSTVYDDAKNGTLSTEQDPKRGNRKLVDMAELDRVYGLRKTPKDSETDVTGQPIAPELLIKSYENRIQDLNRQLNLSNQRETTLTAEKSQLLNMLSVEQEKTRLLLPAPEQRGWIRRWLGFGEA